MDYDLHLGDCLEIMPTLPDKSVDMVLCDLPYGTTACKWDVVIPFDRLWKEYERTIKDAGVVVLFGSQPFTSALVMSNPKLFKYEWVWDKVKPSCGIMSRKQPLRKHENILVFYRKQPLYNPQMEHGTKWHRGGGRTVGRYMDEKGPEAKSIVKSDETDLKYPKSIIVLSNANQLYKTHPTQKPVALCEYLIRTYTNEGELVLDNCMGSGTTGVACANTSRRFIGIEKEEKYYWVAQQRIDEAYNKSKSEGLYG